MGHLGQWSPYTKLARELKGGPLKPKKGTVRKLGQMRGTLPVMTSWTVEVGPTHSPDWLHVQVRTQDQLSSYAFVVKTEGLRVTKTKTATHDLFTLLATHPTHFTINLIGKINYVGTWPARTLET